jgi:hypothetical protein
LATVAGCDDIIHVEEEDSPFVGFLSVEARRLTSEELTGPTLRSHPQLSARRRAVTRRPGLQN